MNDQYWAALRYALIGIGSFFVGKGWVTMDQINSLIQDLPAIVGAATALGSAVWGLYVKWNTKAVPQSTALRRDVPTVSSVTGTVQPGSAFSAPK